MFKKYQHLERYGTAEVEGIDIGECYIFPKLDGTNSSVWVENGEIKAGSRTRILSLENDNAGFYAWVLQNETLKTFLLEYPHLRLYGEFLVPHSLKTYRDSAWGEFYVFDVINESLIACEPENVYYVRYDCYSELLEKHGLKYIPPLAIIKNPSYEQLLELLKRNTYLVEDGKGCGEGIVIKNYDYQNKYGRRTWAKIVTTEFKEANLKAFGVKVFVNDTLEDQIAEKYVTQALCDKVHAKIVNTQGWSSKAIPQLLNTVYYDLVREECWEFIKEHKFPKIDFKRLQIVTFRRVKELKSELF